ncbi:MAG: hypothetical protein BWK73_27980 [Thiothrix lacustris]|uniref:Uncharacterized protein n=1 Tax=Thiothrix lacustris TaxID=525917 RepID=A0A1Y1QJZ1_9GAMM|nr:MAG: hypothetical protein BWK73_27980 [Thiothrix lacustris]
MSIPAKQHWEWSCVAENLRTDIERAQRLIRVCVDSLQLASIPEISHVTEILDEPAEATWEMIKPAKELEQGLFKAHLDLGEAERAAAAAAKEQQDRKVWRDNLPEGAIEAFQAVSDLYRTKPAEDA